MPTTKAASFSYFLAILTRPVKTVSDTLKTNYRITLTHSHNDSHAGKKSQEQTNDRP